jgi:hypothetical protein
MSSGISPLCERSGDGGATKEMLLTVLLSNSRRGLTVDRETKLECQAERIKIETGRKK